MKMFLFSSVLLLSVVLIIRGSTTADVCSLPPETGPCKGAIPRYHWDTYTQKCLIFTYGGCGGNENNFVTEDACRAKCNTYPEACTLRPAIGDCHSHLIRYFYNQTLRACQKFSYTGCGGNANNFNDNTTCEETCYTYPKLCSLKAEPGPCTGDFKRYFWNNDEKECQEFSYGGCQGNENNFKTIKACNNACNTYPWSCQLEPHSGPCPVNGTRYYWNDSEGECQLFPYGGCFGNQNNFKTEEVCLDMCSW
ncbi:carboxypeptidase inhibitor SmCI-like [Hyposmocoma kahamanoa]|uniref:carboxypeptidase inhibitor SmCI-like n=1 Tax=Hyposmocoma kahamanoa TaxID=1477025 RepID=UPI000E6D6010|nr:carboxypeptidase inhibitor SmCI-like [Hyposmocoma kahamanoa]